MQPATSEHPQEDHKIISPFADNEVAVSHRKRSGGKLWALIVGGLLLVVVGAATAVVAMRYVNDPFRTLESFPVSKYLENYQTLAGSKYKATFRVEADLGWKDGSGRLMLFSTSDDPRPIAVFIPSSVSTGIYFSKGQSYIAEIEVKEGGLVYANSFQKN